MYTHSYFMISGYGHITIKTRILFNINSKNATVFYNIINHIKFYC